MTKPNDELFRRTALNHYFSEKEGGGIVRVSPPWTWTLFWGSVAFLFVALLFSLFGMVEMNSRGRGVLRAAGGTRLLIAQVGGTVTQVQARSGEALPKGGAVLLLESAPIQGQLLEADRQVQLLGADAKGHAIRQDKLFDRQAAELRERIAMMEAQVTSLQKSKALFERKVKANEDLQAQGLVSPMNVDETRESLAQMERQLSVTLQSLAQAKQEAASSESQRNQEVWRRDQDFRGAQTKRESLAFSLRQTRITAPVEGYLESLLVKPGDVVQPGQVLGKLVPRDSSLQGVTFLLEKDRAFVKVGDEVRLELDQYPYAEFGTTRARIISIADDLAFPYEIQEALGQEAKLDSPAFRVELAVEGNRAPGRISFRPGMLMNTRFILRKEHPLTLVLEPLRRWLK